MTLSWLRSLDSAQLKLLVQLAQTGVLSGPVSVTKLRSYQAPEVWADYLQPLSQWPSEHWVAAIELLLEERAAQGRVDVVWTKPQAQTLGTLETAVALHQLFVNARKEVLLAGFRVTEQEQLTPLVRRPSETLAVELFVDLDPCQDALGKKRRPVKGEDWPRLWYQQFIEQVWPLDATPPKIWYAPAMLQPDAQGRWASMHVKSVVVDQRYWWVGSANFTQRGHQRNLELGALVDDAATATQVVQCFRTWIGQGLFRPLAPVPGAST